MRVPFIIYADFESVIKPINMCHSDPTQSYTNRYQKHIPISFCFYIKCFDDTLYSDCPVEFTAESEEDDVAQIFINMLEQKVREIYNKFLKFSKKMVFTQADAELYAATNTCHICELDICDPTEKVKDHCHLTDKFRGAAQNKCDLKYQMPKFFPVIFHNLSGYDSHLFIKKLRGDCNERVSCIPNNEKNYISFSRDVVISKFIDKKGEVLVR